MSTPPAHFHDLTREELRVWTVRHGFSPVHAARLWSYVYIERNQDWARMPDLPVRYRDAVAAGLRFTTLPVAVETHSSDGFTRKYLLTLPDAHRIETVLMRYSGRTTACISSQVGCAMGCVFCATGQMGYVRHLTAGEIVAQALHVHDELRSNNGGGTTGPAGTDTRHRASAGPVVPPPSPPDRLRNIVLMGMGEPLHNYEAVMRAVDILREPSGLALGSKKITLSTVGVVPGIIRLADEARPIHLAVSLHGATQAERAALVPVAKKWPLDELMEACRYYIAKQQRRIFYEWTLIAGKNDGADQAHAVGRLLQGQEAQVNLIPLNPTQGYDGSPTGREAARQFQHILAEYGLPSTVRQRRGIDIAAGCGQLASAR
jgi:23S rRNA (adenine2503-C2)-methyltransferase